MASTDGKSESALRRLRSTLATFYHGHSRAALRFQFAVLLIDLAIIAFFIIAPIWRDRPSFLWVDYAVATLLAADMIARALAAGEILEVAPEADHAHRHPDPCNASAADRVCEHRISSGAAALDALPRWVPVATSSQARARGWEDTGRAVVNLVTFIFAVTGFVYIFFVGQWKGLSGYIDALYFTISSMTTTGYGDITLPGNVGKLASVVVMLLGISLLVRLAQALFRPAKVFHPCPHCGLQRHDPDAVHCKACGNLLNIPDEGRI